MLVSSCVISFCFAKVLFIPFGSFSTYLLFRSTQTANRVLRHIFLAFCNMCSKRNNNNNNNNKNLVLLKRFLLFLVKNNFTPTFLHNVPNFDVFHLRKKLFFMERNERIACILYCVKSVQIRSCFWSVFSCIQSEYRKKWTRNNSVFGHFSRYSPTSPSSYNLHLWSVE